jgi:hypothetical protein
MNASKFAPLHDMHFALIAYIESDVPWETGENTDKENRNVPSTFTTAFFYLI